MAKKIMGADGRMYLVLAAATLVLATTQPVMADQSLDPSQSIQQVGDTDDYDSGSTLITPIDIDGPRGG